MSCSWSSTRLCQRRCSSTFYCPIRFSRFFLCFFRKCLFRVLNNFFLWRGCWMKICISREFTTSCLNNKSIATTSFCTIVQHTICNLSLLCLKGSCKMIKILVTFLRCLAESMRKQKPFEKSFEIPITSDVYWDVPKGMRTPFHVGKLEIVTQQRNRISRGSCFSPRTDPLPTPWTRTNTEKKLPHSLNFQIWNVMREMRREWVSPEELCITASLWVRSYWFVNILDIYLIWNTCDANCWSITLGGWWEKLLWWRIARAN